MLLGLSFLLILILTASFFVASEYAIVSVRRTRIEQLVSEKNQSAIRVQFALKHLDSYIAAVQIGITIATLGMGALGEPVLGEVIRPLIEPIMTPIQQYVASTTVSIAIAFIIVTILEIVLGEIVPKIYARQRAEQVSILLIRPLEFFVFIFKPIIWLVTLLSDGVLRLLGLNQGDQHGGVYSIEELEMLVSSSRKAGILDEDEEVILRRVFDFGDLKARQVMLPRTEIEAIPLDATFSKVVQTVAQYKHSRFPVYRNDIDHIVGVLHVKDLFLVLSGADIIARTAGTLSSAAAGGRANIDINADPKVSTGNGFSVESIMRPIEQVPETADVTELLNKMQHSGLQMVAVIDEYGGTAGIVTLEDIMEEIVGELHDEFEPTQSTEDIVVTPGGTMVDGLASIIDVNEELGLDVKSEADTIGGYVFEVLGRKPELHDEIRHGNFTLHIEELDGLRIARVRITQNHTGQAPTPVMTEDANDE
jgi:putative hemolysin